MACNIARLDMPPYALSCIDDQYLLVGGGGGSSKTGVPNSLILLALEKSGGTEVTSKSILEYDTNLSCEQHHPIMTLDTVCVESHSVVLACGLGNDLTMFTLQQQQQQEQQNSTTTTTQDKNSQKDKNVKSAVRKRQLPNNKKTKKTTTTTTESNDRHHPGENTSSDKTSSVSSEDKSIILKHLSTTATDPIASNFLKVMRFSSDGTLVATAGTSAIIKLWEYPSMALKHTLKGHKGDIDDLTFCSNSNKMVSVSRDGGAILWDVDAGAYRGDLLWTKDERIINKYRFRACRFSIVDGDKKKTKLYSLHLPKVQPKKPSPCYLLKWDTLKFTPEKVRNTGTETLCSMSVSLEGNFIGVGTIEGSVDIYISFSLQKLKHVSKVHNSFVTGLCFLPCGQSNSQKLLQNIDTALVSVSVDRNVNMITVPSRYMASVWIAIVLAFVGVLVAMISLSVIGI